MARIRALHAAAILFTIALLPIQTQSQVSLGANPAPDRRLVTAEQVEAHARELCASSDRTGNAARLYIAAASLRDETDPIGAADLVLAAKLLYYSGEIESALSTMIDGAERTELTGTTFEAAHAWINAIHLAVQLKEPTRARAFLAAAQRLLQSPVLTDAERRSIRGRLDVISNDH